MNFKLEPLPYEQNALKPHISEATVDVHYNKHHAGYLKKLADEIAGGAEEAMPLDAIVRNAEHGSSMFRNAAQVWNHTFYWNSLSPDGGGTPDREMASALDRDFGGVDDFKSAFADAALAEFGSGWAWLVADNSGRLSVVTTTDADNPMRDGHLPLLTLDVWEHAYYLDYKNERARYIDACIEHLLNWRFASENLALVAASDGKSDAAA